MRIRTSSCLIIFLLLKQNCHMWVCTPQMLSEWLNKNNEEMDIFVKLKNSESVGKVKLER